MSKETKAPNQASARYKLPNSVRDLWLAQQAIKEDLKFSELKFTLDGRLLGDIGEAIALKGFNLDWPRRANGKRTRLPGVDLVTKGKAPKTVQVKVTALEGKGPSFSPGEGTADFLLFFFLEPVKLTATLLYNGPERPVRNLLPRMFASTRTLPLNSVLRLAEKHKINGLTRLELGSNADIGSPRSHRVFGAGSP